MKSLPIQTEIAEVNGTFKRAWQMWLAEAMGILSNVQFNPLTQYSVPLTGFSLQAPSNFGKMVLNPAGVLATGTVVMPATPSEGFEWRLSSTQAITALTLTPSAGQTIKNAPTALAAGVGIGYTYATTGATWYRLY